MGLYEWRGWFCACILNECYTPEWLPKCESGWTWMNVRNRAPFSGTLLSTQGSLWNFKLKAASLSVVFWHRYPLFVVSYSFICINGRNVKSVEHLIYLEDVVSIDLGIKLDAAWCIKSAKPCFACFLDAGIATSVLNYFAPMDSVFVRLAWKYIKWIILSGYRTW